MDDTQPDGTHWNTSFRMLSDARRRQLLYPLLESEQTTLEAVANELDNHESGTDRQTITISLVHVHLPLLADHDVLEYDTETGVIERAAGFADIRDLLERSASVERAEMNAAASR